MDAHGPHTQLPGLMDGVNATLVGGPSAQLPAAAVAAEGSRGQGQVISLVKFSSDTADKKDQLKLGRVPLVLTASIAGNGGTGPLVGIARWGSGNGTQQEMEFDIQQGFPLVTTPGVALRGRAAGGTLFSVPATSLEIAARNDANFLPSGPLGATPVSAPLGTVADGVPSATASLAIGNRAGGKALTRTLYALYAPAGPGMIPGAGGELLIAVPAFAKRFRVFRNSAANSISIVTVNNSFTDIDGPYNEAANTTPQTYELPGAASSIRIRNTGGTNILVLGAVFELGL